jgi:hypothetical protein
VYVRFFDSTVPGLVRPRFRVSGRPALTVVA